MAKVKSSKTVISSMPKASWREPPRARDSLLKLPKGFPLTPTEKVHDVMPTETALDAGLLDSKASAPELDQKSLAEQRAIDESSKVDSEPALDQLDGVIEQPEEYDGDVEDGVEAAEQMTDALSIAVEENTALTSKAIDGPDDNGDDDHLLEDKERNGEDERVTSSATSNSQLVPACKHRAKALCNGTESVRPHPTDETKIIITYRYNNPAGGIYVQETQIPEVVPEPTNTVYEHDSVIFPDVEISKVPRTKKGSPWTPVPSTSKYEWARGEDDHKETWRVNIFFRRLHRDTHAYQDIYVNTNILKNVDPNDKKFRTSYNKWILQFARRRDATYTQKVVRIHWSVAERRALYTCINTFCAKFGVHRFGFSEDCKLSTKQLQLMANTVNAAPNPLRLVPRGVDAVRGQIVSAHDKTQPKNKAIFDLLIKAPALRTRIASGEVVSRAERKPKFAIPLSDFPVDSSSGGSQSLGSQWQEAQADCRC